MNNQREKGKTPLLVLTTTFPRWKGDVEPPFVFELCRRLSDFEVHVIAPHAPGAETEETMGGVHVHRFRYAPNKLETLAFNGGIAANLKRSPWKYLLLQGFLLGMFFRAMQVARKHGIHMIHAHWMLPTGLIGATMKELLPGDNKLVLTAHGADVHQLKGKLFDKLRRWVANEADCVSVVSQALELRAREQGWQPDELIVAPMGVDTQDLFKAAPDTEEKNTIVFAGRLVPKKGPQHLVESFALIAEVAPDSKLLIAGDGPLKQSLQERVETLGIAGKVRFTGRYRLDELPRILCSGEVVALPFDIAADGDAEGLGLTAIEAMACRVPVIVGDVPAIHDIVRHEVNGLIVDSRDHQAIAKGVLRLLRSPDQRASLAEAGRDHAKKHFDWAVCAQRYADIFQRLID